MSAWVCPNKECSSRDSLKKGDKCPKCGAEAKAFGFFDVKLLFEEKSRGQENFKRLDERVNSLIPPSNNCNFESLQGSVQLNNSSSGEQTVMQLLTAIFEQNKVIIKQNELIYNVLKDERKKGGS